jgi:hypothetical protein
LYELAMLRSPFKEEGLNLYGLFQKITSGSGYPPVSDVYSPEVNTLDYKAVERYLIGFGLSCSFVPLWIAC